LPVSLAFALHPGRQFAALNGLPITPRGRSKQIPRFRDC
jgi:hypothetical protein